MNEIMLWSKLFLSVGTIQLNRLAKRDILANLTIFRQRFLSNFHLEIDNQ